MADGNLFADLIPEQPPAAPQTAPAPDSGNLFTDLIPPTSAQRMRTTAREYTPPEAEPVRPEAVMTSDLPRRLGTAGSQFVGGAADVAAGIPKSIAIAQAQGARDMLALFDRIDQGEDIDPRTLPLAMQSVLFNYTQADEKGRAQMRGFYATTDPRESSLYQAGTAFEEAVAERFPVDPRYEQDFLTSKVPRGLGSAAGFMATGVAGRLARLPALATAGAAGAALEASGQFAEALDAGASLEDAFDASNFGAIIGTSEALPIVRLLDRIDKGTGGSIKKLIANAIKQGTEEAAQEAFQTIASNVIKSDLVGYDPERETFTGTGEASGVGFTVGGLMSTIGSLVFPGRRARRAEATQAPEAVPTPEPETAAPEPAPARPEVEAENPFADLIPEGAVPAEMVIGREAEPEPAPAAPPAPEQPEAAPPPVPTERPPQPVAETAPPVAEPTAEAEPFADLVPATAVPEEVPTAPPQRSREEIVADIDAIIAVGRERMDAADEVNRGLRPAETDWLTDEEHQRLAALKVELVPHTQQARIDARERVRQRRESRRAQAQERTEPAPPPAEPEPKPARQRSRRRAARSTKPVDALRMLASQGGIRDDEGHALVKGRNLQKFIPGAGPLIRPKGMSIDRAGEVLYQAGYFGPMETTERPTEADVLDFLERARERGRALTPEAEAEARISEEGAEQAGEERQFLERRAAAAGMTDEEIAQASNDELAAAIDDDSEERITREVLAMPDEGDHAIAIDEEAADAEDIPFEPTEEPRASAVREPGARPAEPEPGEARETGRVEERRGPEREAEARAGEAPGEPRVERRAGEAARVEPTTEPTAQGEQTVLPGTERSARQAAAAREAEGRGRVRPRREQREADEGLFRPPEEEEPGLFQRGTEARFRFSPAFNDQREAVFADLRRELDRLGLKHVRLQIPERIDIIEEGETTGEAAGHYLASVIDVSLRSPDARATVRHEAIHAMREMGLFTDKEWATLARAARNRWRKPKRQGGFDIDSRYRGQPEDVLTEEAVAEAFSVWRADGMQASGAVRRAFVKIMQFLRAMANALRGNGFETADDVFARIERGEVGRREPSEAAGPPRFQRLSPDTPDSAENRQHAAQGFLSRGQPIDRAMRLPFDWFGGVNEKGEWQPGLKLYDKARERIVNARFSEAGPFAFANPMIENARRGLIDRYGLDPEYTERERKLDRDKRAIAEQGAGILKSLAESDIGLEEARVLQAVLTGEEVADADMAKLAAPIRAAIDEIGAEAVSLGLVSPESYERNRGTYLHRVYMKHEMEEPGLSRMFSRFMGGRRRRIQGDALKGRGLFVEVETARAMRDVASFHEGRRGPPVKGEKYVVLDKMPDQGEFDNVAPAAPRVERRVYWPADEAVPDRFKDFADRGTWEVRQVGKNKIVLWRDFTKEERERMGEILDARYTIGKTFMLMANDLATGRFYRDVAQNEEWARNAVPNQKWVNAAEFRRLWADDSVEWVKVPDDVIPKTGGKRKWGALAGMHVRAEIWRDLNEAAMLSRPNLWTQILTQWKLNKTARSPVVHMNNIMSNVVFMDLADVRAQDLIKGIRAYVSETADFIEARDNGAFGSDIVSQELKREVLQPILDDLQRQVAGGRNPVTARFGLVGRIADALWTVGKGADRKMVDMYRTEDEIFRMATYMRRRSLGDEPETAARLARDQFLDYDIRAPWVNAARRSVLPFIAYTYRAVPVIARSLATRPWKIAKYFMYAQAANYLAYMIAPGDEEEERRSIREEERGYTWIGTPRMMRMPYRDAHGNPVFLDIRRWIPAGDIFDLSQGHAALTFPAPLHFGGPLMLGAELALNKTAFTGEPIVNELTDSGLERAEKIAGWAWKSWMPSAAWVPGSWYWEKIGLAMSGATDPQGRPYPVPEAVASSFGIKLKPQDVEQNLEWRLYEIDKARRALKAQERRLGRQRERNIVSEEAYEEAIENIDRKQRALNQREAEVLPRR